jgi:hypothetical protein
MEEEIIKLKAENERLKSIINDALQISEHLDRTLEDVVDTLKNI